VLPLAGGGLLLSSTLAVAAAVGGAAVVGAIVAGAGVVGVGAGVDPVAGVIAAVGLGRVLVSRVVGVAESQPANTSAAVASSVARRRVCKLAPSPRSLRKLPRAAR